MFLRLGMVIFQENSPSFKLVFNTSFKRFSSRNKIRQLFSCEMATNARKRYFHIDENACSE